MKIIGSGFIARSLKFRKSELKNYILYARGVSNSLSKSKKNFAKTQTEERSPTKIFAKTKQKGSQWMFCALKIGRIYSNRCLAE